MKVNTILSDRIHSIIQSSPVCTSTMTLEDLDAGTSKSLGNADVKISENNITFSAKVNRHYNISGRAVNSKGSSSFIIELSKTVERNDIELGRPNLVLFGYNSTVDHSVGSSKTCVCVCVWGGVLNPIDLPSPEDP